MSAVRGAVGSALGSLTVRGRCLVAGGGTLLVLGALLGERALVHLAVFVLALPLLSAVAVSRERFRLSARRSVTPARVPRGGDAEVLLELGNADRRTGGLWMLSEHVPVALGSGPRFVVERLAGGATAVLRYRVHGSSRGRYALGPLRIRLVDPFGLVLRTTSGAGTAPLVVVPRVRPLARTSLVGGSGPGESGASRSLAVHGQDDVTTREYRQGDDLRKVHWRATARAGELMVRLEERPWQASATLLLDTRSRAHLVTRRDVPAAPSAGPAGDDRPPPDSLEWVVEAAASIGTALAGRGTVVRVATDAGELRPSTGRGGMAADELLDQLAAVRASRLPDLAVGIDQVRRLAGEGPVVALLGAVGPDDVAALARARSGPVPDLAVLVDVSSWARPGPLRSRSPSGGASAELSRQRDEAAALLRAAGWRVAVARADRSVEEVWAELTGPAPVAARPLGVPA